MITPIAEEQAITPAKPAGKKPRIARSKAQPTEAKRAKSADSKQNAKARKPAAAARRGSKTAKVLDLLRRSGGASLKELVKATGWQAHSVRGFLSGTLKKRMGLKLESSLRLDEERAYRLRSK